jgi:hypothetical protein
MLERTFSLPGWKQDTRGAKPRQDELSILEEQIDGPRAATT